MKISSLRYHDFYLLKKNGLKVVGRYYIILFLKEDSVFRYSVIASKKIGNAVRRNYHKRCVRENMSSIFNEEKNLLGLFLIVCLKRDSSFQDKKKDILYLLYKLKKLRKSFEYENS